MPQGGELLRELYEGLTLVLQIPIQPRDLIVLTIGIVVAPLRAAEFVASENHRRSLRQQQRGHHVAYLTRAKSIDAFVVRLALDAAIPGMVVGTAVSVVFTVRRVVLLVIGDYVVQREPIVRRDEVDARIGPAAMVVEIVR